MFMLIMVAMFTAATAKYSCSYRGECQGLALDYLTSVPSPATCQHHCNKNLHCHFFTYNINPHNFLHRHCFFYNECHPGPASSEWVTYSSLCRGYFMSYIYRLRRMLKKNHYKKKYLLHMQEL